MTIIIFTFFTNDFHICESVREWNAEKRGRRDNKITKIAFSDVFSITIEGRIYESFDVRSLHNDFFFFNLFQLFLLPRANAILLPRSFAEKEYHFLLRL